MISDDQVRDTLNQISGTIGQSFRHSFFHPFPARMPLKIAEFLIQELTQPDAVVLDPMAGSGTTLIAAKSLGRLGIGFDLDPLAVLLSRVATATINDRALSNAAERVKSKATELLDWAEVNTFVTGPNAEFIKFWFPKRSQKELLVLKKAIEEEKNTKIREFLWIVFSSLIISKSGGASYALDLSHSRPHKDISKKIDWPLEAWDLRLKKALNVLKSSSECHSSPEIKVRPGDARKIPLKECSVDLILSSPPYFQAIDYIRAHKFSLVWMEEDLIELRKIRTELIGARHILNGPDGIPLSIEETLKKHIQQKPRQGHTRRYISDLHQVLKEIYRVLKPDALALVVVGPSIIVRNRTDSADILQQMASNVGLSTIAITKRKLPNARRALPPPSWVKAKNDLRKRMRSELILAFRKPVAGKL